VGRALTSTALSAALCRASEMIVGWIPFTSNPRHSFNKAPARITTAPQKKTEFERKHESWVESWSNAVDDKQSCLLGLHETRL